MGQSSDKSFWEHVDDLRALILRIVVVVAGLCVVCFCFKEALFSIIIAPACPDFPLFRLMATFSHVSFPQPDFVNTELTGQLWSHFKMAFCAAFVLGVPYVVSEIANYLAPALYATERRALRFVMVGGTLLFYLGMAVAYFLVFPLAYRFLADYVVDPSVRNLISLSSYTDNLIVMLLLMGALFELPIVAVALGRLGIINRQLMRRYRRHAILGILIVTAVLTPTTDILTLLLVGMPIYVLYEVSIFCVRK